MDHVATRRLLGTQDVDALAGALHLLLGEVAALTERIAALEGQNAGGASERITALTDRVPAPLRITREGAVIRTGDG
jgi:hypothetical protein